MKPLTLDTQRVLVEALARVYLVNAPAYVAVARVCDEVLDRRGALLGEVRTEAAKIRKARAEMGGD